MYKRLESTVISISNRKVPNETLNVWYVFTFESELYKPLNLVDLT